MNKASFIYVSDDMGYIGVERQNSIDRFLNTELQ